MTAVGLAVISTHEQWNKQNLKTMYEKERKTFECYIHDDYSRRRALNIAFKTQEFNNFLFLKKLTGSIDFTIDAYVCTLTYERQNKYGVSIPICLSRNTYVPHAYT